MLTRDCTLGGTLGWIVVVHFGKSWTSVVSLARHHMAVVGMAGHNSPMVSLDTTTPLNAAKAHHVIYSYPLTITV